MSASMTDSDFAVCASKEGPSEALIAPVTTTSGIYTLCRELMLRTVQDKTEKYRPGTPLRELRSRRDAIR